MFCTSTVTALPPAIGSDKCFCSVQAPLARAAQPTVLPEAIKIQENLKSAGLLTTTQIHDAYILGPGDSVLVSFLMCPNIPVYSQSGLTGPSIYLDCGPSS